MYNFHEIAEQNWENASMAVAAARQRYNEARWILFPRREDRKALHSAREALDAAEAKARIAASVYFYVPE